MASGPPDPVVGVIFDRESHPGASSLAELRDPLTASKFACDERLPLSEALARRWDRDAHLILYTLVDEAGIRVAARVRKRSAFPAELAGSGGRTEVSILCLDFDLPGHREWSGPDEAAAWVCAVHEADAPAPTVTYTTLRGGRLVYVLDAPVSGSRAEAATRRLVGTWAAAGVAFDRACADWTRLFRLPGACRADTGRRFSEDTRFLMVDGGPALAADGLPDADGPVELYATLRPVEGARPTDDECAATLAIVSPKGRTVMTDFAREARRMLRGRESFPVAFEDQPMDPARLSDGWDNCVMHYVGQVVGMLADVESATPEGCYALLRSALEQLTAADEAGGRDWEADGWEKIKRVWAQERARAEAAAAQREDGAAEGAARRAEIAAAARAAMPGEVPADAEGAGTWLERRMVASDGRRHYVMRRDGTYNLGAVGDSMLVPMIRELGMEDTIPVRELRGHRLVYLKAQEVLARHAVPVRSVRCSAREECARVEGPEGERVLRVPIHRLNPLLRPARSEAVDEWLRALFGPHYGIGCEWLAHALDVANPICALNLHGEPGSGKGMLCQGLAECFEGEAPNDGRAMDRFNIGLLSSPVIWCDEGIPQVRGLGSTADQVFRSLVSGGPMQIEGKMRDLIVADIYPRIVIASNNREILRELVGNRDLTDDDVRAIEQRLLTVPVGPEARRLLSSRGNLAYTRGWVAGEGPSSRTIANHVAALYLARKPSRTSTGRFLVEGETRTEIVRDLRLRTDASQAVLRALARLLEMQTAGRQGIHIAGGRAWVTVSGVADYLDTQVMAGTKGVTMPQVGQVLRQFSAEERPPEVYVPVTRPVGAPKKGRWVELDLAAILEQCLRYGMACDRIESLMLQRDGGQGEIVEVKLAVSS